ncbi:MAG: FAD-dependent oxidoreductase [Thermoflexibacter sp.]|jgi:fumarate reductase flavoprotein subunit|nr:FAD-dependent oxidoreductase [Thermoflexibacter sp.]
MEKFDLIIVGAGASGLSCAINAAAQGAKILVIEKDYRIGGTLHLTAGHLSAGGTKRQKDKGIEDSPQKHYDDIMRISQHSAVPEIAKLATTEAPKTIDWLEQLGFQFDEKTPTIVYGHAPYQIPRTYWGTADYAFREIKNAGLSILQIFEPLFKQCIDSQQIILRLNHKLEKILIENNQVIGIQANHQNDLIDFYGKNTVLTTGGYAANHDFFAQVTPHASRLISTANPLCKGDGIKAAMEIGAGFRGAEKHLGTLGGIEIEQGRADFWRVWAKVSNSIDRPPREIYVNEEGFRFMHEDEPSPDVRERIVAQQPNWRFWAIFDENALMSEGMSIIPQFSPQRIQEEAEKGQFLWKADSISALAKKIGIREDNLNKTIISYNEAVKTQQDKAFGRKNLQFPIQKPPFYALLTYLSSLISFGGITVNQHLQVTTAQGKVIPNLYASGEILGAGATSGNAFCGGMLLTPALSFGRYLGQKLGK